MIITIKTISDTNINIGANYSYNKDDNNIQGKKNEEIEDDAAKK